jgi:hypothetical protein
MLLEVSILVAAVFAGGIGVVIGWLMGSHKQTAALATAQANQAAAEKILADQKSLHEQNLRDARPCRKRRWGICARRSRR